MSKRALHILTTTVLVSAVGFTAFAGNNLAQKADSNKDGVIQLSEFTALGQQKFRELDADANGFVTKAERKALRAQKREARAQAKFDIADSNEDGVLSKAEFTTACAKHRQHMQGKRPKIDINGDGIIDLAEHQAATIARFERMDTNGDGLLDAGELLRRHNQNQHRMRQ